MGEIILSHILVLNSRLRTVVLHYLNILSFILSVSESYQLKIKVTHGWKTENHLFYDEFTLSAFSLIMLLQCPGTQMK